MRCNLCGGLPKRSLDNGMWVCACGSKTSRVSPEAAEMAETIRSHIAEPATQSLLPEVLPSLLVDQVLVTCRHLVRDWEEGEYCQPHIDVLKEILT